MSDGPNPRERLESPHDGGLSRFRRMRRLAFYVIVRAVVAAIRTVPRGVAVGFLRALARVAYGIRRRERRIAVTQISLAYPGLPGPQVEAKARRSFDALALNLADMVRMDRSVRVPRGVEAEFASQSGPLVILMAHLGAWELIGPVLAQRFAPFAALTADPHNARVDAWLRREREQRQIAVFDRERDLRAAVRWLRRGGSLAVLADHRTRGTQVRVQWFGKDAPTAVGPSRLALAGRATVLPLGIRRSGDGPDEFELMVGRAFKPTGSIEHDARRCNAALEDLIRCNPEEWTWIHERYDDI